MSKQYVTIYTDGSALGNPGRGGIGIILQYKDQEKEFSKGYKYTTNNRMELRAVLQALELLKRPCEIDLYTDSQYVKNCFTVWMPKWEKTGKIGKMKNSDLLSAIALQLTIHDVKFFWVKGHSSNPYNNKCDKLANEAARQYDLVEDTGYTSA